VTAQVPAQLDSRHDGFLQFADFDVDPDGRVFAVRVFLRRVRLLPGAR
jgi:hypothetical protein